MGDGDCKNHINCNLSLQGAESTLGDGTCPGEKELQSKVVVLASQRTYSATGISKLGEGRTIWDESQMCVSSSLTVK